MSLALSEGIWQFNRDGFGLAVQSTSHVAGAGNIY